jgi:hypothetical protein
LRSREEEGDVAWLVGPTRQRGKERTEGYRFGFATGPRLASGVGPKGFPGALLIIFFLSSFSFLFSYFFQRICKNAPNHFKPLLEILQNSLQGF